MEIEDDDRGDDDDEELEEGRGEAVDGAVARAGSAWRLPAGVMVVGDTDDGCGAAGWGPLHGNA